MNCHWCEEPVTDADPPVNASGSLHRECAYRAACGSLAHLMRKCSCYVPGSQEGDPEGMTKREAARAAWGFGSCCRHFWRGGEA